MKRAVNYFGRYTVLIALALVGAAGCSHRRPFVDNNKESKAVDQQLLKQVSYEEVVDAPCSTAVCDQPAPFALDKESPEIEYWDLSLDQAIQMALSNSTVLRDLGATIIQAPTLTPTIYGPSIQATDPRFGEQAALSAFDAQLLSRAFYEKNDRVLNNQLLGGGTNFFIQDLWRIESELRKRSATGTIFSLRHNIEDDLNNSPSNIFGTAPGTLEGHAWTWITEAEVRQPLLQGAGVEFNRAAGPDAVPGVYNGVLIARINTEISAADFQLALRDFLSNVENAYWELVFSYRDLEVKKNARDRSLQTWQLLQQRQEQGIAQAEVDKVAQAAEQYYRFTQDVETALSGRLLEGTRDFNGSTGGTFQGTGGVYVAERRLRLIMGLPINDGRLIRPATDAMPADVAMDWNQMATAALSQRVELVQQRLRIKRGNLELKSSEEFTKPDLDVVGRYRFRGFGNKLYNPEFTFPVAPPEVRESDKSEWQVGVELNMPIGFRQGYAGVRNAQLALARERAVLTEMERQVIHDVSNAVAEKTRTFQLVKTAYNRRNSAFQQYDLLTREDVQAAREIDFNLLLDSQRRLADAETDYYRAVIGYAVALKNVYVETGSLMEYCNVHYTDTDGG